MHMIRMNDDIQGISIPDADGRIPDPTAHHPHQTVKERGLVDDVAVAVATPQSIPPLLDTLDRFEAMSNHRMQISKTVLVLLGHCRSFDIQGNTQAATRLRQRELFEAHDVIDGPPAQLPAKWHGVVIANNQALTAAWKTTAANAAAQADALQATSVFRHWAVWAVMISSWDVRMRPSAVLTSVTGIGRAMGWRLCLALLRSSAARTLPARPACGEQRGRGLGPCAYTGRGCARSGRARWG